VYVTACDQVDLEKSFTFDTFDTYTTILQLTGKSMMNKLIKQMVDGGQNVQAPERDSSLCCKPISL